jgi:hypothetical protein
MPRFSKGTTDHDDNGRMGGSRKGDSDMVKVKGATGDEKKVVNAAKKAARKPAEAKPDTQSGMTGSEPEAVEDASAEVEAQFAEADRIGDPRYDEIAAGLAVRGY